MDSCWLCTEEVGVASHPHSRCCCWKKVICLPACLYFFKKKTPKNKTTKTTHRALKNQWKWMRKQYIKRTYIYNVLINKPSAVLTMYYLWKCLNSHGKAISAPFFISVTHFSSYTWLVALFVTKFVWNFLFKTFSLVTSNFIQI